MSTTELRPVAVEAETPLHAAVVDFFLQLNLSTDDPTEFAGLLLAMCDVYHQGSGQSYKDLGVMLQKLGTFLLEDPELSESEANPNH